MATGESEILGAKQLDGKLKRLANAKDQRRAMRSAIGLALNPVVRAARANVPKGSRAHKLHTRMMVAPGFASRHVAKRIWSGSTRLIVRGSVGVRGEAFYVLFYDRGFRRGTRSKAVKRAASRTRGGLSSAKLNELGDTRSIVPGSRWLTKALDDRRDELIDRYVRKLEKQVRKIVSKQ